MPKCKRHRGLHRPRSHAAALQPLRHLLENVGKGAEPAHRPALGIVRDREVNLRRPNIEMRRTRVLDQPIFETESPLFRFFDMLAFSFCRSSQAAQK